MMPYSSGIILDNNHIGIVKTQTVFGFAPNRDNFDTFNSTEPLEWILSNGHFDGETLQDVKSSRSLKQTSTTTPTPESRSKKSTLLGKKHKKRKGKIKKCFFKLLKGKKKKIKSHKKYMVPLILGLLAAKSLLIPIALKALAFISAKGLIMGFFSTMLASFLSLKGMFDHSRAWNRRDDTKTQVEIIQVPSKSDEHIYYDDHYKRGDYIPMKSIK
ncbi:uncharacterized protein [Epargyreus clarus]|uniref:uncharacterized protein n=1 Tax=Epargyreus clarus TaxID=520877 RepID=UPI003C2B65EF